MDAQLLTAAFLASDPQRTAAAAQCAADTTSVGCIMHRDVVCVTPELALDALMSVLLDHEIGGVPVVDPEGNPLGVVSKTDVVRACHEGERHLTVGDIMMPITFVLPETSSIARAAALMAFERVHRIVVMNEHGVAGIVSSLDVLGFVARENGYVLPG
jgi:CBS domain-containing protein